MSTERDQDWRLGLGYQGLGEEKEPAEETKEERSREAGKKQGSTTAGGVVPSRPVLRGAPVQTH